MTDTPVPADQLVKDSPHKQAAVSWPLPIDMHLDRLLGRAEEAGENTSRRELAAAIIADTDLSGEQLGGLLRRYRTTRVRNLLPVPEGENVVPFRKRPPGPRTGQAQRPEQRD